ncbi:glycoside hydrolase family 3 N-terminal domain-containing protein [Robertkochia solimangrovi]|uniref:glycoside hydrolase family 3 N-terminal domain-containing protein n=1 Tax=Robertkochia solimangrovi TaxID=2213046 RepID=UPI00117D8620|nr:glycoside hydrolase family 3 N-terminal domain-containing protein [Robertkochia solimangrovi]TRZ42523.1 beta-N-acetylglucosaminidase [Robertkochia solimangrovi]
MKWNRLVLLLVFYVTGLIAHAQQISPLIAKDHLEQQKWVDSVYNAMTLEERIAQLFMIQVFTDKGKVHEESIKKIVSDYQIGGVIFSKGGPVRQAKLNNTLQQLSKTKMLVAMDAEWGLSMRLDSTFAYPYNMMLGAVKDDHLIKQVGERLGYHCKRLGVHINFAPVVDINTNPDNPIIGNRSFGENMEKVTELSLAFMEGMQSAGVLANAKHFPGHGDTDQDSHKTLPTISFDAERIDSIELYPYKKLFKNGLASVMVAHLNVPALESRNNFPSSLSEDIVTGLLKRKLNFDGLIFTDALNMKGVSEYAAPGAVDLAAFLAGSDVLLIPEDVEKGIGTLKEAYDKGVISEGRLSHSVKKILNAKYMVGLNDYQPVVTNNLVSDLNSVNDQVLRENIVANAITIAQNLDQQIPLRDLDKRNIAYLQFGDGNGAVFLNALRKYTKVDVVNGDDLADILKFLLPYETVIIGFHKNTDTPWKDYKLTDQEIHWLNEISRTKNVIFDVFASPYTLLDLRTITNIESIIVSYQNDAMAQEKSAELIFGAIGARGSLPVSANPWLPENRGFITHPLSRLGFGSPESVGLDSERLKKVDSVIKRAISSGVTPGAQILVARKGKVVYEKSFGKFYYGSDADKITDQNIYDLASLTKIVATLPVLMQMVDEDKLNFNTTLGEMLPELKGTNKEDLRLVSVLSHYARLKPWIPFYMETLNDGTKKPDEKYYRESPQGKFTVKVADELYMREDYKDSIFKEIKDSDLLKKLQYRYSDLPYFLMKEYIEKETGETLDQVVQEKFYRSLGMNYTTYKPLEKFRKGEIVPTEVDDYYRYQTVQGYVHDMAAAMLGGVAGHAGLFSNANDLAKLMQMYLQKGYYGGVRYFSADTFDKFNTCYFCDQNVRRGVGFDKPQLGEAGPTCGCVSMTSFGHSGFTGTYAWVDPEEELVYVFLSNRTFPTMENRKLISEGTRTVIQELIYDSIIF